MLEYAGSQRAGLQRNRGEGVAFVSILRSLDWVLLAGIVGLVAVGLWAVSGVTRFDLRATRTTTSTGRSSTSCVGALALLVALFVDPDIYRRFWRPIYIGTVSLIVIVLVVGRAARGSTRWIDLGVITFQPSEFGKLLFVLAIAGFLAERARAGGDVGTTMRVLGLGVDPRRARHGAARPRHRARLHGRARRDALRRRHAVAPALRARRARGAR